jgi:chromosome segregation ATPase
MGKLTKQYLECKARILVQEEELVGLKMTKSATEKREQAVGIDLESQKKMSSDMAALRQKVVDVERELDVARREISARDDTIAQKESEKTASDARCQELVKTCQSEKSVLVDTQSLNLKKISELDAAVVELKRQNAEVIERMNDQTRATADRVAEFDAQKRLFTNTTSDLNAKIGMLGIDPKMMSADGLKAMKAKVDSYNDMEQKVREMKQAIQDGIAKMDEQTRAKTTEFDAQKRSYIDAISDLNAKIGMLGIDPKSMSADGLKAMKAKVDSYDGMERRVQGMEQTIREYNVKIDEQTRAMATKVAEIDAQKKRLSDQSNEISTQRTKIDKLQDDLRLQKEAHDLKNAELLKTMATDKDEKASNLKKISELDAAVVELKRQNAEVIEREKERAESMKSAFDAKEQSMRYELDAELVNSRETDKQRIDQLTMEKQRIERERMDADELLGRARAKNAEDDKNLARERSEHVLEKAKMDVDVVSLNAEIAKLVAQVRDRDAMVQELEQLKANLHAIKATGTSGEKVCEAKVRDDLSSLRTVLDVQHRQEIANLQLENTKKMQAISDAKALLDINHAALEKTQRDTIAERDRLIEAQKTIASDLAVAETNARQKDVTLANINLEMMRTAGELKRMKEDIRRSTEDVATKTERVTILETMLQTRKEELESMDKKFKTEHDTAIAHKKSADDRDAAAKELERRLQENERIMRTTVDEKTRLDERLKQLQADIDQKDGELKRIEQIKIEQDANRKSLADDNQAQRDKLQELDRQYREALQKEETQFKRVKQLENELATCTQRIAILEKERGEREPILKEEEGVAKEENVKVAEIEGNAEQLAEMQKEFARLKGMLDDANAEIAMSRRNITILQSELNRITAETNAPVSQSLLEIPLTSPITVDAPPEAASSQGGTKAVVSSDRPGSKKPEIYPGMGTQCELPEQVIRNTCDYETIPVPSDLNNVTLTYFVLDPGSKVRVQLLKAVELFEIGKRLLLRSSDMVLDRSLTPLRKMYRMVALNGADMKPTIRCSNSRYSKFLDATTGRACRHVFGVLHGSSNTSPNPARLATVGFDVTEDPTRPEIVTYKVVSGPFGKIYSMQNNEMVRPEQLYIHDHFSHASQAYAISSDGRFYRSGIPYDAAGAAQGRAHMVSAINHLINAAFTYMYKTVYDDDAIKISGSDRIPAGSFSSLPRCDVDALLATIILFPRASASTDVPALTERVMAFEKDVAGTMGSLMCAVGVEVLENYERESFASSETVVANASNINAVMSEAAKRVVEITSLAESMSHT